ncbi:TPA: lipid IV(A) palmitoyltransferase PagP [Legionella pneumophila]|uniref:lipid IV(A) palmitoyltransferase PagP n=1 Tax=Legionella sp. PATHC039 TaxID=2992042 RepID=UPI000778606C|nr:MULTISPECIES: lipid IV(A) palmitoyltransferase PagP [Legionella]HAT8859175.1 lipid IV(A) palmitoyltransferase PagP [Legionella pneumophila subsp. pneumophila]MCW8396337.1 lipid IV(A) palmitoyltransferase PagP [Legionella sp. PATHC039]HAT7073270.1 lipid IV(A) palmitoyltransferase PagP [Legionella pneumophila]HAT8641837.1 lipid IV(A) palmitoyltransferase PagP [Legionella pneumophila]HAT8868362.1 lipid IV(A) palmitoyltransferase PagP [Legionella pneumophila subsp. pneumophila]
MKRLVSCLTIICALNASAAAETTSSPCSRWITFLKPVCQRIHQTWIEGHDDMYFSGYAWHNRYVYSNEKIKSYNETAWGGGLGKSLFDEKGNWHGLYAIAFLDSHGHLEPAVGYAYLKTASVNKDLKAGLGYSVLVTSRVDYDNVPIPGALPWAALFYKRITVAATYIPGSSREGHENGNVLYILGKISL